MFHFLRKLVILSNAKDLKSTLNRDTSLRSDVLLRACPKNDNLMILTLISSAIPVILSNAKDLVCLFNHTACA